MLNFWWYAIVTLTWIQVMTCVTNTLFKVSEKYRKQLTLCSFEFPRCILKAYVIEVFYQRHWPKRFFLISESWRTLSDKIFSWNVAPKAYKRLRCDRSSTSCKKKVGGVLLFVHLELAPSERDISNLFDNSTFESLWVECRCNFSKNSKSKILLKITYNPLKKYQIDFLEQLLTNRDNASSESFIGIPLMGEYNLDYLSSLEEETLGRVVLPYVFTIASPCLPTRVCKSTKSHIDYIPTEKIDDENSFVFDTPFTTDHFCSVVFTEVSAGKKSALSYPDLTRQNT